MAVRTSASFYRRGVPDYYRGFSVFASANYTIFQPSNLVVKQVIRSNFRSLLI